MTHGNSQPGELPTDKHNWYIAVARAGPDKAISAKEAEANKWDVPSPKSPTYLDLKQNQKSQASVTGQQTAMSLGTDHLDKYLKTLNSLIEGSEELLLHASQEKAHVSHLGSVMRNVKSLQYLTTRVVRLVGRLYTSQGWDLKYVHAINTEGVRKLKSRGGYDALAKEKLRQEYDQE